MQGRATYERRLGEDRLQVSAYAGDRAVTQYQSFSGFPVQPAPCGRRDRLRPRLPRHGPALDFATRAGERRAHLTAGIDYDRSEDDRRGYEASSAARSGEGRCAATSSTPSPASTPMSRRCGRADLGVVARRPPFARFVQGGRPLHPRPTTRRQRQRALQRDHPALGVSYTLSPRPTSTPAWARAADATLNELSYATPTTGFNFGLRPSTSRQAEIGIKTFVSDNARINAALFRIETDDEIVVLASEDSRTSYQNAGRTLRQGARAGRPGRAHPHADGAGLADLDAGRVRRGVQRPQDHRGGRKPHSGVPRIAAFAELAWEATPGVTLAGEVLHRGEVGSATSTTTTSRRPTRSSICACPPSNARGRTFGQLLRVDNVLDREYVGSVIVGDSNKRYYEPGPERSVYAG